MDRTLAPADSAHDDPRPAKLTTACSRACQPSRNRTL